MHPRSRQDLLGAIVLAALVGLSGCSDGGSSSAPQVPRPAQAQLAKPAAPAAAPVKDAAVYVYETKNRRDPFRPLIMPRVETTVRGKCQPGQPGLGCLDVKELKLAGIVWGQRGYYALVEAPNGAGYVLRVNDTVGEGARVTKIASDIVAFEVKGGSGPQAQQARVVELRLKKEE
jgi:Tfp pilus assembly protein PilP